MEDAYFYEESENGECVFGVLDGHNGLAVVEYVTKFFPALIFSNLKNFELSVEDVLKKSFLEMDEIVCKELSS